MDLEQIGLRFLAYAKAKSLPSKEDMAELRKAISASMGCPVEEIDTEAEILGRNLRKADVV